jgi:serine/threonine protein kinase
MGREGRDKTAGSILEEELAEARPTGDALALEIARGRIGATLFDELAQPTRLGRFVLLQRLGTGGMGVVYSAYDPELDRRVALKLLHPRSGDEASPAHKRLVREARALAHLSHPNVVPVHDVCVLDGKVALVMELVAGRTLRAWQQGARPRTVRDVLDVYVQAARGLAAAHAAGIVHRDFKPDNAIIGDDGRVRVVDFGLAQDRSGGRDREAQGSALALSAVGTTALDNTVTAPGARVGTPSYMAPEQFAGEEVGPAADQFAFCVALYEALCGERPFDGASLEETIANVRAGRLRPLPKNRRVPAWVHAVICRGLAARPADRHPSMSALIAVLSRDPGRTRRRVLVGLAFTLLATVTTFALTNRSSTAAVEPCAGDHDLVAKVWNQSLRTAITSALQSTGRAYAASIEDPLLEQLDKYAEEWERKHHEVCVTHERKQQLDIVFERRTSCLDDRLHALENTINVLGQIDTESLPNAMQAVQSLPSLRLCDDVNALAAEVPPPKNSALAADVSALRARLAQARALETMGRYPATVALATDVVREAERLDYEPVLAEALLVEGRSRMGTNADVQDAVLPLRRAAELGIAQGMFPLAVEALARRLYVQGVKDNTGAETGAEIDALIPIAESISRHALHDELARPLLFNNLGAVFMGRADPDRARIYFKRALDEMKSTPDPPLELIHVRRNLAMLTPDPARRQELLAQGLEQFTRTLGPAHPWTLSLQDTYAHYVPDPARAHDILAPVCERYARFHTDETSPRLQCLYYLGFLEAELGEYKRAARTLATAAALDPTHINADEIVWHDLAGGYAAIYRGESKAALAPLEAVIARSGRAHDDPWANEPIAHARLGLGLAQKALGEYGPAERELEVAAKLFQQLMALNENAEHKQRLTVAQSALAALHRGEPAATR